LQSLRSLQPSRQHLRPLSVDVGQRSNASQIIQRENPLVRVKFGRTPSG